MEPITYKIRTISDFLAIPDDRIEDCHREFLAWIRLVRFGQAVTTASGITVREPETFDWIDDGLGTLELKVGPAGETVSVFKATLKRPAAP